LRQSLGEFSFLGPAAVLLSIRILVFPVGDVANGPTVQELGAGPLGRLLLLFCMQYTQSSSLVRYIWTQEALPLTSTSLEIWLMSYD
jgi:hypothetical protein